MTRWLVVVLACGLPAAGGGCEVDQKYSQTGVNALQTREYDYGYDQTFDATVGSLFDLGYTITTSDKRGGLLAGHGPHGGVQVKLDQAGGRRTSVRISTTGYGQSRVDKPRIDELQRAIDRRLTGWAAPPSPPSAPAPASAPAMRERP